MNKENNFALVRKPSSAVEKAAPGAKRILSGIVAETLALVKKKSPIIQSKAQWAALEINHPELLKKWLKENPVKYSDLPENHKVKKRS